MTTHTATEAGSYREGALETKANIHRPCVTLMMTEVINLGFVGRGDQLGWVWMEWFSQATLFSFHRDYFFIRSSSSVLWIWIVLHNNGTVSVKMLLFTKKKN